MKILKSSKITQVEYLVEYKGVKYNVFDRGINWNDSFIPRFTVEPTELDEFGCREFFGKGDDAFDSIIAEVSKIK